MVAVPFGRQDAGDAMLKLGQGGGKALECYLSVGCRSSLSSPTGHRRSARSGGGRWDTHIHGGTRACVLGARVYVPVLTCTEDRDGYVTFPSSASIPSPMSPNQMQSMSDPGRSLWISGCSLPMNLVFFLYSQEQESLSNLSYPLEIFQMRSPEQMVIGLAHKVTNR